MKIRAFTKLFVFTLLIAIVAIGCGSQFLAGGKLHFSQSRFERAMENFELAIAETPNDPMAHLWLGRALAELRHDERAVEEITRAAELVSERQPELRLEIVNTLQSYWSKRYNPGLNYASEAGKAKAAGDDVEKEKMLNLAVNEFERAIMFCPDSVQNYSNFGRVLFQLDRREEGMVAFQKARELGGEDEALKGFLFTVFSSLGVEALENAGVAARDDVAKAQADYATCISMFEEAATFQRSDEQQIAIYFNIGYANYGLSDLVEGDAKIPYLEKAKENFEKVLELDPHDESTLRNMAYSYADLKNFDKAIEYGQLFLDETPWDSTPWGLMVTLYNKADNREKSVAYGMVRSVIQRDNPEPGGLARTQVKGLPPNSDMHGVLLDRGIPLQVFTYTSTSRGDYNIWFYWTDGRVYIFQKGKEVFRGRFEALTGEQWGQLKSQ
jgi:tetratricopeptide (TPR) repeat protein